MYNVKNGNYLNRRLADLALILLTAALAGCGSAAMSQGSPPSFTPTISRGSQGGHLTILLAHYNQADNILLAQQLQQRAMQILKTNDIWFLNENSGLSVNYGHFETERQARKEFDRIRRVYNQLLSGPYQFCYVKVIPQPDPPAPAEWNLLSSGCAYSMEIGTYYDDPEINYYNRKADAVQAVKNLRDDGQRAFFVHGVNQSKIYIGCLGPGDVQSIVEGGVAKVLLSPAAKKIFKDNPYYYDNGAKIYDIIRDLKGRKIRNPRPSLLIDVRQLQEKITF